MVLTLQNAPRKPAFLKSWKCLSPGGSLRKQFPRGPFDPSFHFIGVGKGVWGFKNTGGHRLFWNLENVLSPGGTLQSRARKGSNCFYLCFIGVGRGAGGFNLQAVFCLFENLKMFYPPKGFCLQNLMGSIWRLSILLWSRKGFWHFRNMPREEAFLKSWKCFIYGLDGMDG